MNPFGNIKSSYMDINNKEPKYTNKVSTFQGTLDYIFYTNVNGHKLKCIDCNIIVTKDNKMGPYPNQYWPSDHLALKTQFIF